MKKFFSFSVFDMALHVPSLLWEKPTKILELSYRYVIEIESNLVFGETNKSSI